jgi:hypothetical protein
MALEYKKQTNKEHKESLESKIVFAVWGQRIAPAGDTVKLFVQTHFVGSGSDIEIKVEDKNGKVVKQLKGKVFGDYFGAPVTIPEDVRGSLVFTAKLTKHGLDKKSNAMQVIAPFTVFNLKWGQKEARRGDVVKLAADTKGLEDGTDAMVRIYEHDQDGAHDVITKFPCRVKDKKIETDWEYEYHQETLKIPTDEEMQRYGKNYNHPEYYFVIDVFGKRFGEKQESGLLRFKDWIEIRLADYEGKPLADEEYVLCLPDGTEQRGKLDADGYARVNSVPPGEVAVGFPRIQELDLVGHEDEKSADEEI